MKFRAGLMAKDLSLLNGNSSSLPSSIPLSLPHPPSPSPHHTTQGVAQCFEKIGPSCLIYLSERSIKFASPKLGSDEVRVFSEIEQQQQQQQQQQRAVPSLGGKNKKYEEEGVALWVMPPKQVEVMMAEAPTAEGVEEEQEGEKQEKEEVVVLEEEIVEELKEGCVSVEEVEETEESSRGTAVEEKEEEQQQQQQQQQSQSSGTFMAREEEEEKEDEEEEKEHLASQNEFTEALPTSIMAAAEKGDANVVKTIMPEQEAPEHGQQKEEEEVRTCDADFEQEEEEVVINPLPSILGYAPPPPVHVQCEDGEDEEEDNDSSRSSSSSSSIGSSTSLPSAQILTLPPQPSVSSRPVPDEAKQVATTAPPSSPTSVRLDGEVGLSGAAVVVGWGSGRAELERLYDRGFVSEDISLMEVVTVFGLEYLHHVVQSHRERLRELKQGWCLPGFSWRGGACAPNPVVRFALIMWDVARGEARRVQRLAIEWGGMAAHQVQLALPAPPGPGAAEAAAQAAGEIVRRWQEKVTTSIVRTAKGPLAFLQGLKDRGGVMMMRKEKGKGKGGKKRKTGGRDKKRKKTKGKKTGTGVTAAPTTPVTKRKAAVAAAVPVAEVVGE
eukprot:evm.model.NODE_26153_length_34556_cov_35.353714.10